jgi:hypothetical protein
MEIVPQSSEMSHHFNNRIKCPKCKKNFHVDNYPGHQKYEKELEKNPTLKNTFVIIRGNNLKDSEVVIIEDQIKIKKEDEDLIRETEKIDNILNNISTTLPQKNTIRLETLNQKEKADIILNISSQIDQKQNKNKGLLENKLGRANSELELMKVDISNTGGLNDKILNKLEYMEVTEENIKYLTKCLSCRKDYKLGEFFLTLPLCFHDFHKAHILQWFTVNSTCPICKLEIKLEDF